MKALVTGPSSYVGCSLIEELDTLGFEVCALIDRDASLEKLEGLKFQKIQGDFADFNSLCRSMRDIDYVFHLAEAITARHRDLFFEYNVGNTQRLAQAVALVRPNLSRFVYVSSLAAAGPSYSLNPRVESDRDVPLSFYGQSKLQAEKELLTYHHLFPISIIRPSLTYGPRDTAIGLAVETLGRNLMPILRGSAQGGHKHYSALYTKDLCQGIVQAAVASQARVPSGEVFFLSGEGVYTYQELMTIIADHINCDPLKIQVPEWMIKFTALGLTLAEGITRKSLYLNRDQLKQILPDFWICSNQKAKQMLGFNPEFDFPSGVAQAIAWYRRQKRA